MKASEFDKKVEAGGNLLSHLDLKQARRPGREQQRVNVDFPKWMLHSLDREANRLGVPRQSMIKIWIAERLDHIPEHNPLIYPIV